MATGTEAGAPPAVGRVLHKGRVRGLTDRANFKATFQHNPKAATGTDGTCSASTINHSFFCPRQQNDYICEQSAGTRK